MKGSGSAVLRWAALVLVGHAVVAPAEEGEVVERGGPAVGPVFDVVGVAPAWGPVTAAPGAASVADDQRSALSR